MQRIWSDQRDKCEAKMISSAILSLSCFRIVIAWSTEDMDSAKRTCKSVIFPPNFIPNRMNWIQRKIVSTECFSILSFISLLIEVCVCVLERNCDIRSWARVYTWFTTAYVHLVIVYADLIYTLFSSMLFAQSARWSEIKRQPSRWNDFTHEQLERCLTTNPIWNQAIEGNKTEAKRKKHTAIGLEVGCKMIRTMR